MPVTFHTIDEALADIWQGKMVILVDDEARENEGDLTMAAARVTPEAINFMATYGRGLICLSLTPERLAALRIPLMVKGREHGAPFGMAFTVSIEARRGVTTGISAADRATTILTAVNPKTKPEDLVRPGHVFPLRARAGGVLARAEHTEGSVDLARLAGLPPAGVICEILHDDGTMARVPQLLAFAARFGLKIATIKDLMQYRMQREALVRVVTEARLPLRMGAFRAVVFEHEITKAQHLALVKGRIETERPVLVCLHTACVIGDVFGSCGCDCGAQLRKALRLIAAAGAGVLLYLDHGLSLANALCAGASQHTGYEAVPAHAEPGLYPDPHASGLGAQMLVRLGVKRLRLLTNNPRQMAGLTGYGLDVVERVPIQVRPGKRHAQSLRRKHKTLGHDTDVDERAVRQQHEW
jgi:3,4-dihydroxy 2-butanone 4-phosphate synthase/GTP cyclohydrolase II